MFFFCFAEAPPNWAKPNGASRMQKYRKACFSLALPRRRLIGVVAKKNNFCEYISSKIVLRSVKISVRESLLVCFLKVLIIISSKLVVTSSELIRTSSELIRTRSELISTRSELIFRIAELVFQSPLFCPKPTKIASILAFCSLI